MFVTSVKRIIRSGSQSFWRNGFISAASIIVMVITLSVIAGTIFMSAILNSSLNEVRNKVDINVYFVQGADENDIAGIQKLIQALPEVSQVTYTSANEALAAFKTRHANDQFTLQALNELNDNPLGASLNIKAKDPSQYQGIATFLQSSNTVSPSGQTIIDKVNYFQNKEVIDTLTRVINSADRLGFFLTLILISISIIITYNTIRLSIFMSKDEISVMRLVGASRTYIRGPFVVSGAMYGFFSGIITLILFWPVTVWLGKFTTDFFIGLNLSSYYWSNFGQIFLIIMVSGVVIGSFSSYLAARKHLRV